MINPLPLLTIAGSDSGGAAGAQADLKTWAALGSRVYGMSAITAVTAQNSERVAAVHFLPPEMVAAQIDAVLSDYGAAAIKTGFLGQVDIIEAVAERLADYKTSGVFEKPQRSQPPTIVIDPVLVNHRGEAMFGPEVAAAYRHKLFPLADLITPNIREVFELQDVVTATPNYAHAELWAYLAELGPRVLLTGRRAGEDLMEDLFWDSEQLHRLPTPRVDTENLHGSGDTLSAAICAYRAMGHEWLDAIRRAQSFTHTAIRRGADWRLGAGHGPLGHASDE